MKKLSTISRFAAAASIAGLSLISPALAQEQKNSTGGSVGIEVSSPLYDFTINPGSNRQDIIKVRNTGDTTAVFYPEVADFTSNNEDGTPVFYKPGEENETYALSQWVSISKEPISVSPGESVALNFNVTVPANAEPGGHYGGILFGTQPPDPGDSQIAIANKVGSLILVRVAGDAKEMATIKSFTSDKTSYDKVNVKFVTLIENSGNVHVQPKGVITVRNMFGGQVTSINVNELSSNVLPGSTRSFSGEWKDSGLKIGRYTAKVDLTYGNPAKPLSAEISFWILPWTTIIIFLVALVVALVALFFAIRTYNRMIVNRALRNQSK